MENEHARITEQDGILTVTITRPEKLNAISPLVTQTFWEATRMMVERDDLRCMVITAQGKYFTAGIDLSASAADRQSDLDHASENLRPGWNYRRKYREHHLLYDEFENLEKPIVLAAQGICLGAGVEMAMSCDFRFCTPRTEWAVPEIKLGVIAGSGGSSRLARLIGPAWAKYLAMAGMQVSAERALLMGLVHDVFPEETFMDDVYAFCRKVADLPPEAVGMAKLAIDIATDVQDRVVQRHMDRVVNTILVNSDEHRARIARFAKKK
jgi:enoyl-CoA hydratase/carnithine racemase